MPVTKYAIVYSTASKILRRIIVPHNDDSELGTIHNPGPGETMIFAPVGNKDGQPEWENYIHTATGVVPQDSHCVVVDKTNTVVATVMADPALDTHPAGTLIPRYAPNIGIGCIYNSSTGLFTSPSVTISPLSRGNPTALPVVVAEYVISSTAV